MIECTVTCQRCDAWIILSDVHGMWVACCPNCIDDDPTSEHEVLQGKGSTPEDALQNWFDNREMLGIEPQIRLTALATPLATYVVPHSPEGWTFSCVRKNARLVDYYTRLSSAENDYAEEIHYGPYLVPQGQKAANDS
jgi:hypothetical protein